MIFRNTVVALTVLSFTGCTTLRPIEDFSPSTIRQQVEPGDEVRIVALTGEIYELTVTKVESDALVGRTDAGKSYRVHYEAIQYIEVERVDGWMTAGGVLGGAVVVLYIAAVYALYAFFDAIDDASD